MKLGITITRGYDIHSIPLVRIEKRRGRLTLEEVCDLLRTEDRGEWWGHYAVLLNCSESTVGGDGYWDDEPPAGDALDLYPLGDSDTCPCCGNMLPPFKYCPNCGESWQGESGIEQRLATLLQETRREISKPGISPEAKFAWYWTFIGAVDLARQLDFITDERRLEIYDAAKELKP